MNLLLDAMGQDASAALLEKSRRAPIEVGEVLFRPGEGITYVPFPLNRHPLTPSPSPMTCRSRLPRSGTREPRSSLPPSVRGRRARSSSPGGGRDDRGADRDVH